jgi:tetratricopeptide (TPR) repeat protein
MEFSYPKHDEKINRGTVIQLIVSALQNKKFVFGRQLAQKWLSYYPGDLTVQYYLALFYQKENQLELAADVTRKIIETDPEYLSAHELFITLPIADEEKDLSSACIHVLGGVTKNKSALPAWGPALRVVKKSIGKEKFDNAGDLMVRILSLKLDNPIINLFHLKSIYFQKDANSVRNLAEIYHNKWPNTLFYKLILAEQLLESGEEEEAVNLLHDCVAKDSSGQIARRLWGDQHVFLPLWPDELSVRFDFQVPGEVASDMGWNRCQKVNLKNRIMFMVIRQKNHRKVFPVNHVAKRLWKLKKNFSGLQNRLRRILVGN